MFHGLQIRFVQCLLATSLNTLIVKNFCENAILASSFLIISDVCVSFLQVK
jgi:hypothetical protein